MGGEGLLGGDICSEPEAGPQSPGRSFSCIPGLLVVRPGMHPRELFRPHSGAKKTTSSAVATGNSSAWAISDVHNRRFSLDFAEVERLSIIKYLCSFSDR